MANLDEYYSKGEKLYSDFATGADVFDPKHPDVGMFGKKRPMESRLHFC